MVNERGVKEAKDPEKAAKKFYNAVKSDPTVLEEGMRLAMGLHLVQAGHDEITIKALRALADSFEAQIKEEESGS
jgi:hypothetical protein